MCAVHSLTAGCEQNCSYMKCAGSWDFSFSFRFESFNLSLSGDSRWLVRGCKSFLFAQKSLKTDLNSNQKMTSAFSFPAAWCGKYDERNMNLRCNAPCYPPIYCIVALHSSDSVRSGRQWIVWPLEWLASSLHGCGVHWYTTNRFCTSTE